jgi:hypothetical protein
MVEALSYLGVLIALLLHSMSLKAQKLFGQNCLVILAGVGSSCAPKYVAYEILVAQKILVEAW